MTLIDNRRYLAEVVYKDDRGLYGVKPMADLMKWEVMELAEKQYGIRKEWIVEIRYVELPKLSMPSEVYAESYYVDSYSRRFLPDTGEAKSDLYQLRRTEDTQLL